GHTVLGDDIAFGEPIDLVHNLGEPVPGLLQRDCLAHDMAPFTVECTQLWRPLQLPLNRMERYSGFLLSSCPPSRPADGDGRSPRFRSHDPSPYSLAPDNS